MSVFHNSSITTCKLGNSQLAALYKGDVLIWPTGPVVCKMIIAEGYTLGCAPGSQKTFQFTLPPNPKGLEEVTIDSFTQIGGGGSWRWDYIYDPYTYLLTVIANDERAVDEQRGVGATTDFALRANFSDGSSQEVRFWQNEITLPNRTVSSSRASVTVNNGNIHITGDGGGNAPLGVCENAPQIGYYGGAMGYPITNVQIYKGNEVTFSYSNFSGSFVPTYNEKYAPLVQLGPVYNIVSEANSDDFGNDFFPLQEGASVSFSQTYQVTNYSGGDGGGEGGYTTEEVIGIPADLSTWPSNFTCSYIVPTTASESLQLPIPNSGSTNISYDFDLIVDGRSIIHA